MEPTDAEVKATIAAVKSVVNDDELKQLLIMLKAYSQRMIGEAKAAIADQESAKAVQAAEAARQAAQAEAAAGQASYLEVIKALAAG